MNLRLSDQEYFDSVQPEVTPEERAGLNPPTDDQLRRTNPKREDIRENQLTDNNEHGHDFPVENRYDNAIPLESSLRLSWQTLELGDWVKINPNRYPAYQDKLCRIERIQDKSRLYDVCVRTDLYPEEHWRMLYAIKPEDLSLYKKHEKWYNAKPGSDLYKATHPDTEASLKLSWQPVKEIKYQDIDTIPDIKTKAQFFLLTQNKKWHVVVSQPYEVSAKRTSKDTTYANARQIALNMARESDSYYVISAQEQLYLENLQNSKESFKSAQKQASLEELDWEVENTISAYKKLRVSAVNPNSFIHKIKQRYAVSRGTSSKLHPYEQRAVYEYGTTEVPISAAFIMSNGELIDSSGQNQGGYGEGRVIDHREIANAGIGDAVIPAEYETPGSSWGALKYYMATTGNVRVSIDGRDNDLIIDLQGPMNKAQLRTFNRLAQGKSIIIADFNDKQGNRIESGEYDNLWDFEDAYNKVYGTKTTAAVNYPETLSSSEMRGFMMQRGQWLFDAFGKVDYNTIKEMAGAADVWMLKEIYMDQFDWIVEPVDRKNTFPVIVLEDDGRYEVLDGKHRIGEAKARGESTILAYVGKATGNSTESSLKLAYAASNEELNEQVYNEREQSAKSGPELFWGSEEGQKRRFQFLLSNGEKLEQYKKLYVGKTILDVGCGYGDLLSYFHKEGIDIKDYTGVDIIPKIVNIAKREHEETFELRDVLKDPFPDNSFDYVFGIGIFALNCDNYYKYVKDMLKTMYSMCRDGIAANFALGEQNSGEFRSLQPEEVANLIDFAKDYCIEIDKQTNEFTIFIRK
jgi:hypothetical protein